MNRNEFITSIILLGFTHSECDPTCLTHYDSDALRIKLDTGSNNISLWNMTYYTYITQLQKGLGHDYEIALKRLIPFMNK